MIFTHGAYAGLKLAAVLQDWICSGSQHLEKLKQEGEEFKDSLGYSLGYDSKQSEHKEFGAFCVVLDGRNHIVTGNSI